MKYLSRVGGYYIGVIQYKTSLDLIVLLYPPLFCGGGLEASTAVYTTLLWTTQTERGPSKHTEISTYSRPIGKHSARKKTIDMFSRRAVAYIGTLSSQTV